MIVAALATMVVSIGGEPDKIKSNQDLDNGPAWSKWQSKKHETVVERWNHRRTDILLKTIAGVHLPPQRNA